MKTFYNEISPFAAKWLRNLSEAGLIASGHVEETPIEKLKADQLTGIERAHFFAGIGGWDYALKLAGWPEEWPVWTGSCPCQPFSSAGKQGGGNKTSAISGPISANSSPHDALQLFLENRLRAALDVNGSPEYVLTWKLWDINSGPPICALRASARRTSDNAFSGWPTPTINDTGINETARKGSDSLSVAANLAGWSTPSSRDWKDSPGMATEGTNPDGSKRKRLDQLPRQAQLAGWATPRAEDSESSGMRHSRGVADTLSAQTGQDLTSSGVGTKKSGVLSPAHSRWLMGFPSSWDQVSPSPIKAGRGSSKVTATPSTLL